MTGYDLVLGLTAVTTAAASAAAVLSRQVVHAALWLVVALGGVGVAYLALGAEVVALVQLLVYVGAVVVLVLFALMLTRAPIGPGADLDSGPGRRVAAALAGLATTGLLAGVLVPALAGVQGRVPAGQGGARALGQALFGGWLLPFELVSVLLLAALVGALALSRGRSR